MMGRIVHKNKYYCFRCGTLVKRPINGRPKMCKKCIVERYYERLEYFRKLKKSQKKSEN